MGEFEALDQALLFKLAQRPLLRQFDGFSQGLQGLAKVVKTLLPTNVGVHEAPCMSGGET